MARPAQSTEWAHSSLRWRAPPCPRTQWPMGWAAHCQVPAWAGSRLPMEEPVMNQADTVFVLGGGGGT